MSPELINSIGTLIGIVVAALGAFLFAFWIAMGIWSFNDIRGRTRDWLVILLAVGLVLIFPIIGLVLYMMIRPRATLAEVYDRALEEEALLRELEQTLSCHQCGVPVKDGWVYCPNCHSQLQHSCPGCGQLARNDWEICVYCGAPQTGHAGVGQSALPAFQPAYSPMGSAPATVPSAVPSQLPGSAYGAQPVASSRSVRNPFRRPESTPLPTGFEGDESSFHPVRSPRPDQPTNP